MMTKKDNSAEGREHEARVIVDASWNAGRFFLMMQLRASAMRDAG
jgi:hypothetical protein